MEFAEPFALALALLAIPVAFLARRKPRGYTVPSTAAVSTARPTLRLRTARWLPALRVLAVIALAVAVAGPRRGDADAVVPGEGIDIALAFDISSSMDTQMSAGKSRLQATQDVIREFIKSRTDDRVGLVVFAEEALALSPPSLDYNALDGMVATIDKGLLPDGTGIGVGLASSLNMLQESTAASRIVILLTDGQHNADSISPEQAAELAVSLKIRVYTIGVVSQKNPGINPGIDERLLVEIADRTGATYFEADSPQQLQEIYDEIGSLERSRVGRASFESFTEWAPWFAAAGAGLVALELVLRGTVLRRAP
jgi:Ca-activated chloride channel family protein